MCVCVCVCVSGEPKLLTFSPDTPHPKPSGCTLNRLACTQLKTGEITQSLDSQTRISFNVAMTQRRSFNCAQPDIRFKDFSERSLSVF